MCGKNKMGEESKAIWIVTYKSGYRFFTLYLYCLEDEVETLFNMIRKRDFMQPIELHSIELAGELIDIEEYRPTKTGSKEQS